LDENGIAPEWRADARGAFPVGSGHLTRRGPGVTPPAPGAVGTVMQKRKLHMVAARPGFLVHCSHVMKQHHPQFLAARAADLCLNNSARRCVAAPLAERSPRCSPWARVSKRAVFPGPRHPDHASTGQPASTILAHRSGAGGAPIESSRGDRSVERAPLARP